MTTTANTTQFTSQYVDDWDKPCLTNPDEDALFRSLLGHEVAGLPGVLARAPGLDARAVGAARARALDGVNRRLDAALAALGVHPGRAGLGGGEFLAAMRLHE